jgi:hypothetical protein
VTAGQIAQENEAASLAEQPNRESQIDEQLDVATSTQSNAGSQLNAQSSYVEIEEVEEEAAVDDNLQMY